MEWFSPTAAVLVPTLAEPRGAGGDAQTGPHQQRSGEQEEDDGAPGDDRDEVPPRRLDPLTREPSIAASTGASHELLRQLRSDEDGTGGIPADVDGEDEDGEDLDEWGLPAETIYLRRAVRRVLQRVTILPLYSDLFYRAQQCTGAADAIVHSRLTALHSQHAWIPPRIFDASPVFDQLRAGEWDDAVAALAAVEQQPLPYLQVEKLLACVRHISRAVEAEVKLVQEDERQRRIGAGDGDKEEDEGGDEGAMSADDFFPLFLWVVATARPARLATTHSFLVQLLPEPDARGQVEYYMTTLESALYFLSRLQLGQSDDDASVMAEDSPHFLFARAPSAAIQASPAQPSQSSPAGSSRPRSESSRSGRRMNGSTARLPSVDDGRLSVPMRAVSVQPPRTLAAGDAGVAAGGSGASGSARHVGVGWEPDGRTVHLFAAAVMHPLFRSVEPADARYWLVYAAQEMEMEMETAGGDDTASQGSQSKWVASSNAVAAAMCGRGPNAGWLWLLHPIASDRVTAIPRLWQPRFAALSFLPAAPQEPSEQQREERDEEGEEAGGQDEGLHVGWASEPREVWLCQRGPQRFYFQAHRGEGDFVWAPESAERSWPAASGRPTHRRRQGHPADAGGSCGSAEAFAARFEGRKGSPMYSNRSTETEMHWCGPFKHFEACVLWCQTYYETRKARRTASPEHR